MMAVLVEGAPSKQNPAALSAGATGALLKQQRPILDAAAQSRLFNIAHSGGGLTGAMCGIASAMGPNRRAHENVGGRYHLTTR